MSRWLVAASLWLTTMVVSQARAENAAAQRYVSSSEIENEVRLAFQRGPYSNLTPRPMCMAMLDPTVFASPYPVVACSVFLDYVGFHTVEVPSENELQWTLEGRQWKSSFRYISVNPSKPRITVILNVMYYCGGNSVERLPRPLKSNSGYMLYGCPPP